VKVEVLPLSPDAYSASPLHGPDRVWGETNCAADLWIEALHALGHDPIAGLGFTLSTDFDGDQWRMFKYPVEDLRRLYGIEVDELNVWRPLLDHVSEQLSLGHLMTIDVDAWYLPDTAGLTYGVAHQKTTVMAQMVDVDAQRLGYFHNGGYYELSGDDFCALFSTEGLPPYAESVRIGVAPTRVIEMATDLVREHLGRRPSTNPLLRFAAKLDADVGWLAAHDLDTFHRYAFGTVRQCGANAELAASLVGWLDAVEGRSDSQSVGHFLAVANGLKSLEFVLARAARGRSCDIVSAMAEPMAAWDLAFSELGQLYGR
jgi:hypothetical protein